jgi:hypothetical protein
MSSWAWLMWERIVRGCTRLSAAAVVAPSPTFPRRGKEPDRAYAQGEYIGGVLAVPALTGCCRSSTLRREKKCHVGH